MSDWVINHHVLPIVERLAGRYFEQLKNDENFRKFLEEELRRRFGLIGSNNCNHLEAQIVQAKVEEKKEFDRVIEQLIMKYAKLKGMLLEAPPDRFSHLRKKAKEIWKVA